MIGIGPAQFQDVQLFPALCRCCFLLKKRQSIPGEALMCCCVVCSDTRARSLFVCIVFFEARAAWGLVKTRLGMAHIFEGAFFGGVEKRNPEEPTQLGSQLTVQ